ncbi:MAG: tetratricopeptide repeat protein, partial [Candidatus Nitrotoga sp.]
MLNMNRQKITIGIVSVTILCMGGMTACGKTQTSETLVAEAKQYQQKGDNKAAIIQLKNALQKTPEDAEVRYILGTIYNETADFPSAEKELRKALSLGMNPAKVSPDLGKSLLMQGKFQAVLDEIKQVPGEKESAEISVSRGNAYLALGKGQEAKESFEQALKNTPDFPEALIGLARHSITEKNIDAATGFTEQAVTKNPQNTDVVLFKGDFLRAQGKIDLALAAYDQALKLQPDNNSA